MIDGSPVIALRLWVNGSGRLRRRSVSVEGSGLACGVVLGVLRRLVDDHLLKALRYCAVSAVNVVVGLSVLITCHAVLGWPAVAANISAWMVSTVPAYLMSRAWVWNHTGAHRIGGEVVPFWIMALTGLGLSTLAVGLVERHTDLTVFVVAGNIGAYGLVWVAKYVFLDQVLWRGGGHLRG